MIAPFLNVLPHAALRKIVISQFLRPLKPLQVAYAATGCEASSDEEADNLQAAFCQRPRGALSSTSGTNSEVRGSDRGLLLLPQETLEVKNSKEFLIADLDAIPAADLAARLSYVPSARSRLKKAPLWINIEHVPSPPLRLLEIRDCFCS